MFSRRWIAGVVLSLGFLAALSARAEDPFFAQDKYIHFTGSVLLSAAVTHSSGSTATGFWTAVAAGVAKEVYDHYRPGHHTPSAKDLVWDVMGAYVGSQGMGWYLRRRDGQTVVGYTQRF